MQSFDLAILMLIGTAAVAAVIGIPLIARSAARIDTRQAAALVRRHLAATAESVDAVYSGRADFAFVTRRDKAMGRFPFRPRGRPRAGPHKIAPSKTAAAEAADARPEAVKKGASGALFSSAYAMLQNDVFVLDSAKRVGHPRLDPQSFKSQRVQSLKRLKEATSLPPRTGSKQAPQARIQQPQPHKTGGRKP